MPTIQEDSRTKFFELVREQRKLLRRTGGNAGVLDKIISKMRAGEYGIALAMAEVLRPSLENEEEEQLDEVQGLICTLFEARQENLELTEMLVEERGMTEESHPSFFDKYTRAKEIVEDFFASAIADLDPDKQ